MDNLDLQTSKKWVFPAVAAGLQPRRAYLRRGAFEFSQSLATVPLDGFHTPNRDYPYEGFSALTAQGNWKFVDAIAFSLLDAGSPVKLTPTNTIATPRAIAYNYSSSIGMATASYSLSPSGLEFLFEFPHHAQATVKPLVDIRFMYDASPSPQEYECHSRGSTAVITTTTGSQAHTRHSLKLYFPTGTFTPLPQPQHWNYRLGSGGRNPDGTPCGQAATLFAPGAITFEGGKASLALSPLSFLQPHFVEEPPEKLFRDIARQSSKTFGGEGGEAVACRAEGLALLSQTPFPLPEAGAFWFRTPWFSDAFFTLAHNPLFYSAAMPLSVRKWLSYGASHAHALLPTKLDERTLKPSGESLAATLNFLHAADALSQVAPEEFAEAGRYLQRLVHNLKGSKTVFLREGLLYGSASYGWTDAIVGGVPTRVPPAWRNRAAEPFALVELNALWVRLLHDYGHPLAKVALSSFRNTFGNPPFGHIADLQGNVCRLPSSHALSAAATLAPFLPPGGLKAALEASKPLGISREGALFGIITLAEGNTYFGDEDYHARVAWPRETLWLIDALERLGEKRLLREVLESNLRHQQEEGAVFYNHELFAVEESKLIPVKNPVQLWSQWVDPYLRFCGAGNAIA
ncbi:MAG: hypothetical protein AABW54_01180 [Candidatus Micrarchaeota archaeon]